MAPNPEVTLEQWRALVAVVDAGGYAQAAQQLHKSQSSITYAVQKLEGLLGVAAFEVQGRKAKLTVTGELLYRRARALLTEASDAEDAAKKLSAGWEAEIRLAVEVLVPGWLVFECLALFGAESPHTQIELYESVIEGTSEALQKRSVDLALTPHVPSGMAGEPLLDLRIVCAAHPRHPLHQLGRTVTRRDLRKHRHLVVRDTSSQRKRGGVSIEVAQRWTLSSMQSSIEAAAHGHGFAWYPEELIRDQLASGRLAALPMRDRDARQGTIYLVHPEPDAVGPGTQRLAAIIREQAQVRCRERLTPR